MADAADTQVIEILGRNALVNDLLRAGLEVARPERDRGIDLLAYIDKDLESGRFSAVPIQMKATRSAAFSISEKYSRFPTLVMAHVWNVAEPGSVEIYALTYAEAHGVADDAGWLKSRSWTAKPGQGHYVTTKPSKALRAALEPYRTTPARWRELIQRQPQADRSARTLVGDFELGQVLPIQGQRHVVIEVFINGALAVPDLHSGTGPNAPEA